MVHITYKRKIFSIAKTSVMCGNCIHPEITLLIIIEKNNCIFLWIFLEADQSKQFILS